MTPFQPDQADVAVRASPNVGERRGGSRPEILLLHYTGMASGDAAEDRLCDASAEVSCHYIVHEDGRIVQMVRERDRAWHAGKSSWHGVTDINSHSIGVEIVNPGHTLGYRSFPRRQIASVVGLCRGIVARHEIRPEMVLGHSDVAPGRKVDPGELFPWTWLHREGIGHFVKPSRHHGGDAMKAGDAGPQVAQLQAMLARYGYGIGRSGLYDPMTTTVVGAFQRHFRPSRIDGVADPSTVATLRRLLATMPDLPAGG